MLENGSYVFHILFTRDLTPINSEFGGALQRRIIELARCQKKQGIRPIIFAPGPIYSKFFIDDIPVFQFGTKNGGVISTLIFLYWCKYTKSRELPAGRGLYHFHSIPEGAWVFRNTRAKKVLSFDFFTFRRSDKFFIIRWFYRYLLNFFDLLLPVSDFCRNGASQFWNFKNSINVKILPNGVNSEQFHPISISQRNEIREKLGISKSKTVFLYLGRVCEQKGIDLLIDATKKLNGYSRFIEVVVAGPLEYFNSNSTESNWLERFNSAGIRYLGAVHESTLSDVYACVDVFVMPTKRIEMFCMAAVEAQSCGIPVIASKHGGLTETVSKNTGLFFESGNAEDLASKMLDITSKPEIRAKLAAETRNHAAQYSWGAITKTLYNFYNEVSL